MVARVKMACFGLGVNAVVRLRRLGARKIENKLYDYVSKNLVKIKQKMLQNVKKYIVCIHSF